MVDILLSFKLNNYVSLIYWNSIATIANELSIENLNVHKLCGFNKMSEGRMSESIGS